MKQFPPLPELAKYSQTEKIDAIKRRLEERQRFWHLKLERNMRELTAPKNADSEESRIWLEQFVKVGGEGLDICTGSYTIGGEDTIGVDSAYNMMGNHLNFTGDSLVNFRPNSFDYIVCNYFDCFESPLKALNEWLRVLKPAGVVAFVCSNAECFDLNGTLLNGKRQFLYTPHTITQFMNAANFQDVKVQVHRKYILVNGVK